MSVSFGTTEISEITHTQKKKIKSRYLNYIPKTMLEGIYDSACRSVHPDQRPMVNELQSAHNLYEI